MTDDLSPAGGSLLAALGAADRDHLLSLGKRRQFSRGQVLMRQGDPTDHVLVLVSGWVQVRSTNADGQEVVLAIRGPGDLIGELAAITGRERTVSVTALDSVTVNQLRRGEFMDFLRTNPDIPIAVIKQVAARLLESEHALLEFATQDVNRRVAGYLLRMAGGPGAPAAEGIELSQQDIANRIGASPRAVARTMALLRDRGIVQTRRRRIVIVRHDVLRSFAR